MLLSKIEGAIAQRLKPLERENLKVLVFPDDPKELKLPAFNRIIVRYLSESLTPPQTFNPHAPCIQQRFLEFQVFIQYQDLRAKKGLGVTDLMDQIRDRLTFFKPIPDGKWLYQTSGGFSELFQDFWAYTMNFTLPYPYTKQPE
jgi:hypothetical protein